MKNRNSKLKIKRKNSAFTFIEVLAAVAVLAIGLLSVVALSSKSYAAISLQKNKLIATNLVREEMEIIRNIRNENWLYKSQSDCNKNGTVNTCIDGQIYESGLNELQIDCDWRCGDETSVSPSQPTFILDEKLKDLDYLGNANYATSGGPFIDCFQDGAILKKDSNGFYQHSSGDNSPFRRLVTLRRNLDENGDSNLNNDIQVIVTVCWQERGRRSQVSAEEHLFNWKK